MSLGIDIGKYCIKIVQLSKNGEDINVDKIGMFNIFSDIKTYNLDKISKSKMSSCVQDLLKQLGINPKRSKNVISSISGGSVDARQVTTLDMPDNELLVSLELEAKKHMPLDGTDAIIDYHHIGNSATELDKINVILVTTTKNKINDHATIIKNSGLKAGIFDADPIALSNLYQFNHTLPDQGADVILNIGHNSTTLVAWGKNSAFFTRDIELGGHEINKRIIQDFGIDYKTANEKKETVGIDAFDSKKIEENTDDGSSIAVEKKTIFNDFIDELRKTLRYYLKNNNQSFLNTFYLTGGCSRIPGLKEFIASNLNVKIEDFDPMKKIKNSTEIENPDQYSLAIGLAMRGLEE